MEKTLENAYALVIGISKYQDKRISELKYTHADADAFSKLMIDPKRVGLKQENVKVLLDENATLSKIKESIVNWLIRKADDGSTVFIFFAGHGGVEADYLKRKKGDLAEYLLPYDTNFDSLFSSALSNGDFHDFLQMIQSKKVIIFLDACHSGGVACTRDVKITEDPYKKLSEGEGRVVICASKPDQLSYEDANLGHGVFTYHLLEALSGKADTDNDGYVTIFDLYKYLKNNVTSSAREVANGVQEPVLNGENIDEDFRISINPGLAEKKEMEVIKTDKIERLWNLYQKMELSYDQYLLACKVVENFEDLSEEERKVFKLVNDFLDSKCKNCSRFRKDIERFMEMDKEGKVEEQRQESLNKYQDFLFEMRERQDEAESKEIEKRKAIQEEERFRVLRKEQDEKEAIGAIWEQSKQIITIKTTILKKTQKEVEKKGFLGFGKGKEIVSEFVDTEIENQVEIRQNSVGMKFTLIPPGEFMMGSEEDDSEKPVHRVKISKPFYLGTYPVTQKEWKSVMGNDPSDFEGDNRPVVSVSWNVVQKFIDKLNENETANKYRLPSEAEWEYAARAGTTTRYSFGDDESKLGEYAWYAENSGKRPPKKGDYHGFDRNDWIENRWSGKTYPVGEKKPNLWGLYDMHGNVWEWIQDTWHDDYKGAPTDGSSWAGGDGSDKVIRGGAWKASAKGCRSARRYPYVPDNDEHNLGFRLVRIL